MKKILLIAIMAIFTTGAFAANMNSDATKLLTKENKDKISSLVNKLTEGKNTENLTKVCVEPGYILIKITISADCPGWYSVIGVLTIKIWDTGGVEFYPWSQDPSLVCS